MKCSGWVCIWGSGTEKAGGVGRKEDKEANIFETLSYVEIPYMVTIKCTNHLKRLISWTL